MGAADLQQIRRSSSRPKTLGRRPDASWFAQTPWEEAREGTARAKARPRLGGEELRRGAHRVLGPWPGTRAVRARASWRVRRGRPRARESAGTTRAGVERTRRTRRRVPALPSERTRRVETPGAAAGPASPRNRSEKNPSRERETPRTDRGGRGKPAPCGSLRRRRWRGVKPQEGRAGPCRAGEDVATRTLRGRPSLWKPSRRLRAARQSGRRNTSRPSRRRGGSGNL